MGAARAGAGAVTVLSPATAMAVNAAHLNAIMLKQAEGAADIATFVAERRVAVLVYGPGLAPGTDTAECLNELIATGRMPCVVVDAGALTALAADPDALFATSRGLPVPNMALTPHEGEFGRVFPDLAADLALSKLDRARLAAKRASAVVIFKGPDTVIASPDGRAAINCNGTPLLATAGSGDVLAGIVAGLAAQGMPLFEACCAAVLASCGSGNPLRPGPDSRRPATCAAAGPPRTSPDEFFGARIDMMRLVLLAILITVCLCPIPVRAEGPVLTVDDRAILTELEAKGYGFGDLFRAGKGASDLEALYAAAPAIGRSSTRSVPMSRSCGRT